MNTKTVQQTRLSTFYHEYLKTQDTSSFIRHVESYYTPSTLLRLATSDQIESRRAAVLALTYLGDYAANDVFGRLLHDDDQTVRLLSEIGIKNLWPRDGDDRQRNQLRVILRFNASDRYPEALEATDALLDEFPRYAEAWNQRAIAHFGVKRFDDAIEDASTALNLNPFHFGAAAGMGHAYLQQKEWIAAIDCFQLALEINPNLQSLRDTIAKIEQWCYQ